MLSQLWFGDIYPLENLPAPLAGAALIPHHTINVLLSVIIWRGLLINPDRKAQAERSWIIGFLATTNTVLMVGKAKMGI